ncbi:MAG: hypothetical protein IPN33_22145 [Saprospiraceae bacterium]|nr:hypothetical protein [Saprospiraceae bacterium]
MNKKNTTCFCFCLFAILLQGQVAAWEDISKDNMAKVFEQMSNWFKNTTNYTVTVTHASYENHSTTVPFEKSTGYFKKEKENYHSFLLGIHTLQNLNYRIVLDTVNKVMMVANVNKSIWSTYTIEDYKYILKTCAGIQKTNSNLDKRYRITYPEGYPLERYEFLMANDGSLKEVVMYYSKKVAKDPNDENSEKVKPRLSITFSTYKKVQPGASGNEFDEKKYFVQKGNKLFPTKKYQDFTLSDQRLSLN